jgi:hypothetical protein
MLLLLLLYSVREAGVLAQESIVQSTLRAQVGLA